MTSDQAIPIFRLKQILFPKIEFKFIRAPTVEEFIQAFRIEVLIQDDNNIRILYGISLTSKDHITEEVPVAAIIVESFTDVEFMKPIGTISNVSEIPLFANILAIIFPFLREKINYCFSNNNYRLILGPINTIEMLQNPQNLKSFIVTDGRRETPKVSQADQV